MGRSAQIDRRTKETQVRLSLGLDGQGRQPQPQDVMRMKY